MSRLNNYRERLERKQAHIIDYIPFPYKRLRAYIPGLIPGVMYKVTSHTGNGKTQFAKHLVFSTVYNSLLKKTKYNVIYLALEESKEEFLDSLYLYVVNIILKVPLKYYTLLSLDATDELTSGQLAALAAAEPIVEKMMNKIELVDDVYTPLGLYEACKKVANRYGEVDDFDTWTRREGEEDRIFMVVADHISLMKTAGVKLHDSISEWHTDYCKRIFSKEWNWIVMNIQQQNLDSEKAAFTSTGKKIIDKVIPSLDGLGDNRTVVRDDYVVFGLFSPDRYHIDEFFGYQIGGKDKHALGDNLRVLYILKNRLGIPNKALPLYFDGGCSFFQDLPLSKEPAQVADFKNKLNDKLNRNYGY